MGDEPEIDKFGWAVPQEPQIHGGEEAQKPEPPESRMFRNLRRSLRQWQSANAYHSPTPSPEQIPSKMDSRHLDWLQIGFAPFAIGAGTLLGIWITPPPIGPGALDVVMIVAALFVLIGVYIMSAPWTGAWLPEPKEEARKTYRLVVLACCIVAAIGILFEWSFLEHRAVPLPQRTVASTPQFRLLFLNSGNIFVYSPPGLHGSLTGITLDAKIWNTGTPSVVSSWSILVDPENGNSAGGQSVEIRAPMHIKGRYVSPTIRPSDSLDAKTAFTKVGQTPVEGTLLFYVPLRESDVLNSTVTLTAKDIYGNPYSITVYMRDLPKR